MAGELLSIGTRPLLVASFDPPRAAADYRTWRNLHADALAAVPPQALRVEYGRAPAGGLFVRVRLAEEYLPPGLAS